MKRSIKAQILDGHFPAGEMLPAERELCEQFDVSRITVKRALDELAAERTVVRLQGKGTMVVNAPLEDNAPRVEGFSKMCRRLGVESNSHVLDIKQFPADALVRKAFGLSSDDNSMFMGFRRLLSIPSGPVALVTSIVPLALGLQMVELGVEGASFYDLISQCTGHRPERSSEVINPIIPSPDVCEILEINPASAHFHSRVITYLETGLPIEVSFGVYVADKIQWTAERYEIREEVIADSGG
ncbi:MAG: GntR family transcriptional regulator [Thermomicrobiales bacterium]|nr:GntR family transcriptional regulator [Thermomicrobiales bacterium]